MPAAAPYCSPARFSAKRLISSGTTTSSTETVGAASSYQTSTSTRRFSARPSTVALVAMGLVSPAHSKEIASGGNARAVCRNSGENVMASPPNSGGRDSASITDSGDGVDTVAEIVPLPEDQERVIHRLAVLEPALEGLEERFSNALMEAGLAPAAFAEGIEHLNNALHVRQPLQLADLIGLDTTMAIAECLYEEFKEPVYATPPLLSRMVEAGHLGRKSGRGFYDYSSGR